MGVDIEIDGVTNYLVNHKTFKERDTQYRLISKTITKANTLNKSNSAMRFGEEMPDSRLTEPSDRKGYRLCEAILLSKRLGRPLTKDEMEQFII